MNGARPQLPALALDEDGSMLAIYDPKYTRNVIQATQRSLEARGLGLEAWATSSDERLDKYYTQILTRTIYKNVELSVVRSIDDVINEMDDGRAAVITQAYENVVDAAYETDEYYD